MGDIRQDKPLDDDTEGHKPKFPAGVNEGDDTATPKPKFPANADEADDTEGHKAAKPV